MPRTTTIVFGTLGPYSTSRSPSRPSPHSLASHDNEDFKLIFRNRGGRPTFHVGWTEIGVSPADAWDLATVVNAPPSDQEFPRRAVVQFAAPPTEATVAPHRYPDAVVEGMRRALSPFRATGLEGARESRPHGGSDNIPIHARRLPRDSTSRNAHESAAHNSGVIPDTNTDNAELDSDASRTLRPARAHEGVRGRARE
ncbi:hypothetical protein K438DRAFT_1983689 [Mycena galopus ATCC 62051]|nr:hypothetical protein K438DRAFT_1983689 [Mycena galopus ATCC 62051]